MSRSDISMVVHPPEAAHFGRTSATGTQMRRPGCHSLAILAEWGRAFAGAKWHRQFTLCQPHPDWEPASAPLCTPARQVPAVVAYRLHCSRFDLGFCLEGEEKRVGGGLLYNLQRVAFERAG